MPSQISSPSNSFVRFNIGKYLYQNNCYAEPVNKCLPVIALNDIQFQIQFANIQQPTGLAKYYVFPVPVEDADDDICSIGSLYSEKIGNPDIVCAGPQSLPEVYVEFTPDIDAEPLFIGNILVNLWNTTTLPESIAVGTCFRFIMVQSDLNTLEGCVENTYVLGCSNCFVRIDSEQSCYTSRISYRNNENSFGFNYEDKLTTYSPDFENIIRLPFYLYGVQYPSEKTGYQKSDGSYVKLSERINEQWQLKTDYMVKEWHLRLKIALSHDEVNIQNDNSIASIEAYNDEDYNIEWSEDEDMIDAIATTVIKLSGATEIRLNSNCK